MVTRKGTSGKKIKEVKAAVNVMADPVKTEEKPKAEVKTEIKAQEEKTEAKTGTKVQEEKAEAKTEVKAQEEKAGTEAKAEKKADKVEQITKKAVKEAVKGAEAAKNVAKAATKTVKKAAKKEMKVNAFVEYYGKQVEEKDMIARVKKAWTRSGKKVGDIKEMNLYIKPEENAVYYVINGTETGSVEF